MADYGLDYNTPWDPELGCFDLDPAFTEITGAEAHRQALMRRFVTPRGHMFWAPNDGLSIMTLIGEGLTPERVGYYQSQIVAECEKDERTESATAALELVAGVLNITINVVGSEGPFELVFQASESTLDLLVGDT